MIVYMIVRDIARGVGRMFGAFARSKGRTKLIIVGAVAALAVLGAVSSNASSYPTQPTKAEQAQWKQDKQDAARWAKAGHKEAQHGCVTTQVVNKTTTGTHPSRTHTVTRRCG